MRLYYPNLTNAYSAITGTSRASTSLSYENVAHDHKAKLWRTGTAVATEYVTIDLGSAKSATAAIIFGHTLLNTDSTIELRKSNDNFGANDVLVGTFTWSAAAMLLTFAATSERYWRFKFTKAAAGVSRDIARVFLGNYVDLPNLPDWDGFKVKVTDLTNKQRSEGAQIFSGIRPQFRTFHLDASGVTQTEIEALKLHGETVGIHTPFFLTVAVGQTDETGEILYVQLSKVPDRNADAMGEVSGLAWTAPIEAEEAL